jgi:molecular chaperone IbpA
MPKRVTKYFLLKRRKEMTKLTAMDLSPFYRNTIGVDRLFDRMLNNIETASTQNYPPYNIVQINDDEYMISIAVAGFGMDNLNITQDGNTLCVEGTSPKITEELNYLHKGIGARSFRREFTLADHVEVETASLELGMLNIHLKREIPEAMKPKTIAISHIKE